MPRLTTFIDNDLLQNIQKIAEKRGINPSRMAAKLIETGYKVQLVQEKKSSHKETEKMRELIDKHTEYLLRILATTSDILRCVHNEKSKYKSDDIETIIDGIREKMQEYISGYIGKNQ